jgi:hypothetical protein
MQKTKCLKKGFLTSVKGIKTSYACFSCYWCWCCLCCCCSFLYTGCTAAWMSTYQVFTFLVYCSIKSTCGPLVFAFLGGNCVAISISTSIIISCLFITVSCWFLRNSKCIIMLIIISLSLPFDFQGSFIVILMRYCIV